jgi:hypothetical protein
MAYDASKMADWQIAREVERTCRLHLSGRIGWGWQEMKFSPWAESASWTSEDHRTPQGPP